ncbi:MAG TPA: hypothetical protein VGL58_04980 [Caulobacteraceae bacterium]|jgi:hypothetical protein
MPVRNAVALLLVLAAALSACRRPDWANKGQQPGAANASAPPVTLITPDSRPALPAWAALYMGKAVKTALPQVASCAGNLDIVTARYEGANAGAKVIGWGWDTAAAKAVDKVVLVDAAGLVVGAGEGGLSRPDVPQHSPTVTSPNTGWAAIAGMKTGAVDAFGVINGQARCPLGHLEF